MEITEDAYRQISRLARAAARKLGRLTPEDGDDLTQDVALKLWRFRERIRSPERLPALAYRTAVRTWLNACRSRTTRKAHMTVYYERATAAGKSAADGGAMLELSDIAKHIDALDARLAEVMRRHLFGQESCAVIGRALGVSKSTAHNFVRDGLQQLRAKLADADDSDDLPLGVGRCRQDFSRLDSCNGAKTGYTNGHRRQAGGTATQGKGAVMSQMSVRSFFSAGVKAVQPVALSRGGHHDGR